MKGESLTGRRAYTLFVKVPPIWIPAFEFKKITIFKKHLGDSFPLLNR
jgi:hypothetical protein